MKTLDEILDETAQNFGYESFEYALAYKDKREIALIVKNAAIGYARQVAEAVKQECINEVLSGIEDMVITSLAFAKKRDGH